MTKRILTSVLVLGLFALVAAPVSAHRPPRGPEATAVDFIHVEVVNTNLGKVMNFSIADANSGWNIVGGRGGLIDSGNAEANTEAGTVLNTSKTVVEGEIYNSPTAMNSGEGLMSPEALAMDFIFVDVDNFNMGKVCNFSVADANTGYNLAGKYGDIDTGNATAKTQTETTLNSIDNKVSVHKEVVGPLALNLEMGGEFGLFGGRPPMPRSGPKATAIDFIAIDVDNLNVGCVGNFSVALANSGRNAASKYGEVETGKALASTETETNLNMIANDVSVSEAGQGPTAVNFVYTGFIDAQCCRPGGGSPKALAINGTMVGVHNFNFGLVENLSLANANTGENIVGKRASITTGDATASTGTANDVNSISNTISVSSSNGPMAINAEVGLPDGGCASTELGCGGMTTGTVAANIGTPGTAVVKDMTVVEVENTNVAMVDNVSVANANTGNNVAGCGDLGDPCELIQPVCTNTCGGGCYDPCPIPSIDPCQPASITTGDATAETSVENTVNTSETTITISR